MRGDVVFGVVVLGVLALGYAAWWLRGVRAHARRQRLNAVPTVPDYTGALSWTADDDRRVAAYLDEVQGN